MMTLPGCGATLGSRAGADIGRANAGLTLERQPDVCGNAVPHIALREGQEIRTVLKRERAQLDAANNRISDCYAFNENLRRGLSGK